MIDLLLLGVIAASALLGLMRGLLATVFAVASWLVAGWAAFSHGRDAAVMLAGSEAPTLGQYAAGHVLAFVVVMLVVSALGMLLRGLVNSTVLLKAPDRLLGFALGAVRGLLLAVLLVLVLGFTSVAEEAEWQRSQVVAWLQGPAGWLRARLPDLPAMPEQSLLDLGKAVLAGDNAGLNDDDAGSGLPQVVPEAGGDVAPQAAPEGARPSNLDPAQVRPDHADPVRAGPSGQARPPSR